MELKFLRLLIITAAIWLTSAFFPKQGQAIYDPVSVTNNKFGIHILFPSELEEAARLVNSSGGQWGYVTVPIRSDDRNLEKWQKFIDRAKASRIIPILRLATIPEGDLWTKPTIFDPLDWANFLNSLDWPTKNRYVIVYNEPNRAQEWGNEINPSEYAMQLKQTSLALKRLSADFFVLPAGLDASAPTNHVLLDEYAFILQMYQSDYEIFRYIDGWTSHSYPNPGFSSSPSYLGRYGITSYRWELDFLQRNFGVSGLKVFITETGWDQDYINPQVVASYFVEAFSSVWNQDYIVAVTPFLLSASEGVFKKFSWTVAAYQPLPVYEIMQGVKKESGQPPLSEVLAQNTTLPDDKTDWSAQNTGFWHETTVSWLKRVVNWFLH